MSKQEETLQKTSELKFYVTLDDKNLPVGLHWEADDHPIKGKKNCKSILIGIWDGEAKNALRIDLWTNEMEVNEMNHFFFQMFLTMADTYNRATGNAELSRQIQDFARDFAKQLQLMPKK